MNQLFKDHILRVAPVISGATRDKQPLPVLYKLSSNENLLGASPKALEAIRNNLHLLNEYSFQNDEKLRMVLSRHFQDALSPQQFITANGGAELLEIICRAFLVPGDECILSTPTFMAYKSFAGLQGANVIDIPLKGDRFEADTDNILAAVNEKTRLIFITNPNNPTGTVIPRATIAAILDQLPSHVIMVYDEVYHDYVNHPDFGRAQEFIATGKQVIGLHSFSKIYGMAGLRLGYAFSTLDIAAYLHNFRRPFMINTLSMEAAIAALGDETHLQDSKRLVATEKKWLYHQFQQLHIRYWESEANYILFRPPLPNDIFIQQMLLEGVMVRAGESFGISDCARVTIGTHAAAEAFINALKKTCNIR